MVYSTDSTQPFTITLSALLEGFGNITFISVYNLNQDVGYVWDGATWSPSMPQAVEGDSFTMEVEIQNEGAVTDTLYGEIDGVGVNEPSLQEGTAAVGNSFWPFWSFTMPPQNITIDIYAGHVE